MRPHIIIIIIRPATAYTTHIYYIILYCTIKVRCACKFFKNKTLKAADITAAKGVETRMQLSTAIVYNYVGTEFPARRILFGAEGAGRESATTYFPYILLNIITRAILYVNPLSSLIIGSTPSYSDCVSPIPRSTLHDKYTNSVTWQNTSEQCLESLLLM